MKKIIIIPGAKELCSKNKIIQSLILFGYKLLSYKPDYSDDWYKELEDRLKQRDVDGVIIFEWSRGIRFSKDIIPASKKLREIVDENSVVFAFSVGGLVAERMLEDNPSVKIKKLIEVATPHVRKKSAVSGIKIINIYSNTDTFIKIGCALLSFGKGRLRVEGQNITNIHIPHMTHNTFTRNIIMNPKDPPEKQKKLFDFFVDVITAYQN